MAVLNQFSAIVFYCDSTHCLLLAAEFLAILGPRFWVWESCGSPILRNQEKGGFSKGDFLQSRVSRPKKQKLPKEIGPGSTFGPQSATAKREGPTIKRIQSRSKSPISIEIFNLARKFQSRRLEIPTKIGPRWVARSKILFSFECSISLESRFFFDLWALWVCDPRVPLQRSKLENQENDLFGVKKCLFGGGPLGTI